MNWIDLQDMFTLDIQYAGDYDIREYDVTMKRLEEAQSNRLSHQQLVDLLDGLEEAAKVIKDYLA